MAGTIDRLKGTVTWFDARRGFGFITPVGGGKDIFVHQSSIIAEGFRALSAGETVEFVLSEADTGRPRAINVTGPSGACIQGQMYFTGACYRCREVGHMARDCKRPSVFNSPGHRDINEAMRHLTPFASLSDYHSESTESDEMEFPKGREERNWAELPRDVLSVIFKMIAAVEILSSAQFVCKSWRQLSLEPEIWRCIDLTVVKDSIQAQWQVESMELVAKLALDRSAGCLEEFYGEFLGNNGLLSDMAERAPLMRCLHLISARDISDKVLAEAVRRFTLLEELWISVGMFSDGVVELVGRARPQLRVFRLTSRDHLEKDSNSNVDTKAFAIAKHMQQLRHLQLIGNNLTSTGLLAILNGCPYLEHLDIRRCFNVVLDENLMKKCTRIKELRLPNDSTADFMSYPSISISEEESDGEYRANFDDGATNDEYYEFGYGYLDRDRLYDDDYGFLYEF